MMKAGDQVFFHCGGEVTLQTRVVRVDERSAEFQVINGGYTLHAVVDNTIKGTDYNLCMDRFARTYGLRTNEIPKA